MRLVFSDTNPQWGESAGRSPLGREASVALHPSLRRIRLKIWIRVQNVNAYLVGLESVRAGVFTPFLAKRSKSFSLIDCISVGVDRMQRSFEPMRKQVEAWQRSELTDVTAEVVIYEASVEGTRA